MFQRQQPEVTITQLAEASGYDSFGGWITAVKKKYSLTQDGIARAARRHFEAASVKPLPSQAAIGRLERNDPDRYPHFRELEPLYRALVERGGLCLPLSVEERELYLYFARKRIEERQRKEQLSEQQWQDLADRLLLLTPNPKSRFHLVRGTVHKRNEQEHPLPVQEEDPDSRRKRAIQSALDTDLRLFLEREEWVAHMLNYPEMKPQMKVVVVQGGVGTGKSYAATFLLQHLDKQEHYFLIPHLFEAGESKMPDDYLEEFLATVLSDLTFAKVSDEGKQRPLERWIDDLFAELHKRAEKQQKVIFVLDNAHLIFPNAGAWSPGWSSFLERFARDSHSATMYVMTRTWPGWDHPLPFVERTDLPTLSLAAAVSIWHHFGFLDVPQDILEKISVRCGYNPQMIELLVAQCQSCLFGVRWKRNTTEVSTSTSSPNTQKLEALLAQDSIFGARMDTKTRMVLQSAVNGELSHQAKAMLECLACSPLGLPFCLLAEEFAGVEDAFNDLANASLIDLTLAASERAIIAPFAREAVLLALASDGRRDAIESRVTDLYAHWLSDVPDFRDDREKASLVAEMVVRYLRARRLLEAAEVLLSYWWLCSLFGQTDRIQRVFEAHCDSVKSNRDTIEETKHEVGRLLLQHRVTIMKGQKVDRDERDQMYQEIYGKVVAGEIQLGPHAELEVLHNMLLLYNRRKQFGEAKAVFDQTFERLQCSLQMTPEVSATFFSEQSLLMVYQADALGQIELSLQYTQASVDYTKESIKNWQLCLKNALPLQEKHIQFKLGRALNDLACDLRTLKQYVDAQKAIEKSIQLKKKSGTLPHSIAIAVSEYGQILAAQGKIQEALSVSEGAKQILEESIKEAGDAHKPELGLVLKERAKILLLQARLGDVKPLLEQAVALIGDKPLRQRDKEEALALLKKIQPYLQSSRLYQLDRRWFPRFFDLMSYSDLDMLTQSGPWTHEERQEWERLCAQEPNEETAGRMQKLMTIARLREAVRSFEQQCAPVLTYPRIHIEDVRRRIRGLTALQQEIEGQEANAVVCRLYRNAINEHVTFLRLCEATVLEDPTTVMQCSLSLFGKPSEREFKIALQQLWTLLLSARTHHLASPIAREVGAQLEAWGLSHGEIMAEEVFLPEIGPVQQQKNHALLESEKRTCPAITVCRFFQDVLASYGERDWNISAPSGRAYTSIEPNTRELMLPDKPLSVKKIRQLLAEEVEIHTYRAIAGRHSPLALLEAGLAHNIATDEGLAYHYVQSVSTRIYGECEEKKWNGTLALGLASGILTPVLSFQELRAFLEKMFLVSELLTTDATWDDALTEARRKAWSRCCRTFRGIPRLDQPGHCFFKDRAYLQGHLEVSDYLTHGDEQRLHVGCIGVEHLADMVELHILAPNFPHQHLALATDLADHLASYE